MALTRTFPTAFWSAAIDRRFFPPAESKGKSGDQSPHSRFHLAARFFGARKESGDESPHSKFRLRKKAGAGRPRATGPFRDRLAEGGDYLSFSFSFSFSFGFEVALSPQPTAPVMRNEARSNAASSFFTVEPPFPCLV
jgi:hypothetical protein